MGLSNYIPSSRIAQSGVCTSTTRPASPFQGQMVYETDTNRVLIWDNAAWVMIADTDSPPGLQLIKTQSITSGSTANITDCFTSNFSNYRVNLTNIVATGSSTVHAALLVDTTINASNWVSATTRFDYGANAWNFVRASSSANVPMCVVTTSSTNLTFDVFAPQRNIKSTIQANAVDARGTTGYLPYITSAILENSTQYNGLRIGLDVNSFSSCDVSIYGYRD